MGEGSVIGVIPAALQPCEVSGLAVGEVFIVDDMHTRKAMMAAEADAFIALPGGYGTLEEVTSRPHNSVQSPPCVQRLVQLADNNHQELLPSRARPILANYPHNSALCVCRS